jgi:hypothetical protein
VVDINGAAASQSLSLTVDPVPVETTTSLPAGTINTSYSQTIQVSDGTAPYLWDLISGTLPAGLNLNTSTGEIFGTSTTAGIYRFKIQVTDSNGITASQSLSLTINAPASGWTELMANGASGSPPARWQFSGVWDTQANRFLIFGGCCTYNDLWQYTTNGGWTQLTAQGAAGSPGGRWFPGLAWDSQNNRMLLFGGFDGSNWYNDLWQYTTNSGWQHFVANGASGSSPPRYGHSVVWDSQANRLLVFGGSVFDSGIQTQFTNDFWQYTVTGGWQMLTAQGALNSPQSRRYQSATWDSQNNRFLVFGGERSGSDLNDLWQYTTAGGWQQLIANGSAGAPHARAFSLASWDTQANHMLIFGGCDSWGACTLYNDLWRYTNDNSWQVLTPQGSSTPLGRMMFAGAWDSQANRLLVFSGIADSGPVNDLWQYKSLPQITTTSLQASTVGASYSQTLQAAGGTASISWSVSLGTLPPGLNLDSASGVISGTSTTAGFYHFTVQIKDADSLTATQDLAIIVNPSPTITTTSLPDATVSGGYSQTLGVAGGTAPFLWSLSIGILPAGITLSPCGVLSGTPTLSGTYSFTVQVSDSYTVTASRSLTLIVNSAPVITRGNLPDKKVGSNYSQTVTMTGGTLPFAWSISSGSLPTGLSLNPSTGLISGVPTVIGTYTFAVRSTDANNVSANKTFTIQIKP